jgi:lipopolysaccharide transport system permease protein
MGSYLKNIWSARYFFLHLARAELRYKFRRSKLGLLWTMINPLIMTLMMSFVLGNLLNFEMKEYAPYIFSGLIVWEFMIGSVVGGSNSLIVSEPYIKQFKNPFAIFPLKTTIVNAATFLIAIQGLMLWILLTKPANLLVSILTLPFSTICLLILGWPIAILTSFTNTKYRDFSQILALFMQLLWYSSPVFFKPEMFQNVKLVALIDYNPITYILNLVRQPMLYGKFPSFLDFYVVICTAIVLYLFAIWKIHKTEKSLIFYL